MEGESQLKRCYRCKENLPIEDFVKDKSRPDGYGAICKPCDNSRSRDQYARNPERRVWLNMKDRCLNPANKGYARYGGRGITFVPEWQDFDVFFRGVGRRPSSSHTLERRDNNGPYAPWNCYWATYEEQNRNRGDFNIFITAFNESLTAPEWSERTGIEVETIRRRIDQYGYSPERALTQPVKTNGTPCLVTFQGRTQRRAKWAHELNIKPRRLESLLTKHSIEEAFRIADREGRLK